MTAYQPPYSISEQTPPGPESSNRLFNLGRTLIQMRQGPMYTLLKAQQTHGDLVRVPLGFETAYLINHPTYIQHVLRDNNRNYTKPERLTASERILGNGLLTSEGSFWRQQRRLIQPVFHRRHINQLSETMTAATASLLDRWATFTPGQPFDIAPEMMQLTLDIVTQTLFSTELSAAETAKISAVVGPILRQTRRQLMQPFGTLLTRLNPTYQRQLQLLDDTIYGFIAERRANPTETVDLLNLLLAARDEETGQGMDDKQLRDEALTIFLAGHETTANLLIWSWMLLSQQATARRQMLAEIDGVLNGRTPTPADLSTLPLTRAIVDETLRLYPPAWIFARQAITDDEIGGYHIPAGSPILISPYILHRHPAFWPNPEGFDPQRFQGDQKRPRYAYLPFGGGPRLCIGQHFALMEAMLIIVMISQRYQLDLKPGHRVKPVTTITLRPKEGLVVTLRSR